MFFNFFLTTFKNNVLYTIKSHLMFYYLYYLQSLNYLFDIGVKCNVITNLFAGYQVYTWIISLLKYINIWIMNFIWFDDVYKRKLMYVVRNKVCKPIKKNDLGLRPLKDINEAANINLCWKFITLILSYNCKQ